MGQTCTRTHTRTHTLGHCLWPNIYTWGLVCQLSLALHVFTLTLANGAKNHTSTTKTATDITITNREVDHSAKACIRNNTSTRLLCQTQEQYSLQNQWGVCVCVCLCVCACPYLRVCACKWLCAYTACMWVCVTSWSSAFTQPSRTFLG